MEPHGSRTVNVQISVEDIRPGQRPEKPVVNVEQRMNKILRSYVAAMECCNNIPTSNNIFNSIMVRSLADLNMMRISLDGDVYHSAGVPWYDTLFGRDSIISALQLLPFDAGVARSTLLVNAKYQGRKTDDWRDEEPGKILHELRTRRARQPEPDPPDAVLRHRRCHAIVPDTPVRIRQLDGRYRNCSSSWRAMWTQP